MHKQNISLKHWQKPQYKTVSAKFLFANFNNVLQIHFLPALFMLHQLISLPVQQNEQNYEKGFWKKSPFLSLTSAVILSKGQYPACFVCHILQNSVANLSLKKD